MKKALLLPILALVSTFAFVVGGRLVAQDVEFQPSTLVESKGDSNEADQQTSADKYENIKVETVLEGLHNPCGIAIHPESGEIYVADSGALRVIRVADGESEDVITGFTKDVYGEGPKYDIGPLGLCFLDSKTLVVGGGGKVDGEEMMRLYKIPAVGEKAINADKTHGDPKMLPKSDDAPGEGNFYGLVKGSRGVFVTCNGDDTKGWVSLVTFNDKQEINELSRSISTKEATGVDAPVAITLSPDGYLTVGQMGEIKDLPDSLLTFYSEEGDFLGKYETGLNDITGLAFGPNQGRLYATDFKWSDTKNGGLYKLVGVGEDRKQGCKAELVTKLEKPTAMTFSESGDLYILLAGNTSEGSETPNGKLIKISGLDEASSE